MRLLKIGITLLCLVNFNRTDAQFWMSQSTQLSSKINSDSSGKGISFAHIFNESSRIGTISEEDGKFAIPVKMGDTLIISALGYLSKLIFVSEDQFPSLTEIRLIPRYYEIEEVQFKVFRNYAHFKYSFLNVDLPETQTENLKAYLADVSKQAGIEGDYNRMRNEAMNRQGVLLLSTGLPFGTKEERQREKLDEIVKKEANQRIIDKKYNREIVYKVTQLPSNELTVFMSFCNFNQEFLLKASDYEIVLKIAEKFELYKIKNDSGNYFEKPVVSDLAFT